MKIMKYHLKILVLIICIVFDVHNNILIAQETPEIYQEKEHNIEKDDDPVVDIHNSIPKTGSLFGGIIPKSYTEFKESFFNKTGLMFGLSYQSTYQKSTESLTEKNSAWGGWFLLLCE